MANDDCVTIPERLAVAAIPPRLEVTPDYGWNAGADSVTEIAGGASFMFSPSGMNVGTVAGFRMAPVVGEGSLIDATTDPNAITHGFYFRLIKGTYYVCVIEGGVVQTANAKYNINDEFEVARVDGEVVYRFGGVSRQFSIFYRSTTQSTGNIVAGVSFWASDDTFPEEPLSNWDNGL